MERLDVLHPFSLQRSDMSIEHQYRCVRAPVLNPDLSGRSAMCTSHRLDEPT